MTSIQRKWLDMHMPGFTTGVKVRGIGIEKARVANRALPFCMFQILLTRIRQSAVLSGSFTDLTSKKNVQISRVRESALGGDRIE